MNKKHGTNLLMGRIHEDGTFHSFAFSKSCDISENADTIETSSPTSGRWKTYLKGRCSWGMNCECLLAEDENEMETLFRQNTPIEVSCRNRDNTGYEYRGLAIITSLKQTGRLHELVTYSITLKGTGELAYQAVG